MLIAKSRTHLPSWYCHKLLEAQTRAEVAPGHSATYCDAGYHLGIHYDSLLDEDVVDTAQHRLDQIGDDDTHAMLEWLWVYFPNFVRPVPRRRRESFATGFITRVRQ